MSLDTPSFVHDFAPGPIHFGRGCVSDLGEVLAERGLERAVVVCGGNVGANRELMAAVEAGLGDRLAATFDGTTPAKRIEAAYDGVEAMREADADALVPVGAGSSLDTAKAMSVLGGEYRPLEAVLEEAEERGRLTLPEDPDALTPTFPVPTTFAGADLSLLASQMAPRGDGSLVSVGIAGRPLMPDAVFYDPACFETTPMDVLAGSAFNGLDKAVEMVYSTYANPITDATAVRGLQYLREALPRLRETDDPAAMERAVVGVVLAQYGLAARGTYKASVVHAFGHGLRKVWGVQQGVAHAVMAPHVLRLLFEQVDGRRDLLAEGLGVADADDRAEAVIGVVEEIRDGLGLPERIRDLDGTDEERVREVAEVTHADSFLRNGPDDFDPSADEMEATLRAAW